MGSGARIRSDQIMCAVVRFLDFGKNVREMFAHMFLICTEGCCVYVFGS